MRARSWRERDRKRSRGSCDHFGDAMCIPETAGERDGDRHEVRDGGTRDGVGGEEDRASLIMLMKCLAYALPLASFC